MKRSVNKFRLDLMTSDILSSFAAKFTLSTIRNIHYQTLFLTTYFDKLFFVSHFFVTLLRSSDLCLRHVKWSLVFLLQLNLPAKN